VWTSSSSKSAALFGDIESLPFLEAIRQMRLEPAPKTRSSSHVTLVPFIAAAGELKTKPTSTA